MPPKKQGVKMGFMLQYLIKMAYWKHYLDTQILFSHEEQLKKITIAEHNIIYLLKKQWVIWVNQSWSVSHMNKTVLFWKESPEALLVFRYVLWLPEESQNPGIFHFSRVFSAQLSDQLQ